MRSGRWHRLTCRRRLRVLFFCLSLGTTNTSNRTSILGMTTNAKIFHSLLLSDTLFGGSARLRRLPFRSELEVYFPGNAPLFLEIPRKLGICRCRLCRSGTSNCQDVQQSVSAS